MMARMVQVSAVVTIGSRASHGPDAWGHSIYRHPSDGVLCLSSWNRAIMQCIVLSSKESALCISATLGNRLEAWQLEQIGDVDVAIVPTGGPPTMSWMICTTLCIFCVRR